MQVALIPKRPSEMTEKLISVFDLDCAELLARARDSQCTDALNELSVRLWACIERLAQAVARPIAPFQTEMAREFVGDSVAVICAPYVVNEGKESEATRNPRIFAFDPSQGRFESWCICVLKNLWVSLTRTQRGEGNLVEPNSIPLECPIDWLSLHESFSQSDLKQVWNWSSGERIVLLCLSGLFVKVPAFDWKAMIRRFEDDRKENFASPFPAQALLDQESPSDRIHVLATWLNMRPNTLSQRWSRKIGKLADLTVIRDVADEFGDKSHYY